MPVCGAQSAFQSRHTDPLTLGGKRDETWKGVVARGCGCFQVLVGSLVVQNALVASPVFLMLAGVPSV